MINSPKLWYSCVVSIIVLLTVVPGISAEDPWILLDRDNGGVYYNKKLISKIDDNIMEVYISSNYGPGKQSVKQMRIDCKNKKVADGKADVYIGGALTQSIDFSRNGWGWLDITNSVERKLFRLVCKKK